MKTPHFDLGTHTWEFMSLRIGRVRTLRANFAWNAAGNAVFALSQWATIVIFAKGGSPSLVGAVVYGLAVTTPLFVIAGLQLRSIQATDPTHRYAYNQYLGLRTLTTFVAAAIAVIIAIGLWPAKSHISAIILMWALSKTLDAASDALYGIFQQNERMDFVGASLALRGFLGVVSVAILFRLTNSVPKALLGMAALWLSVFALFDVPIAHRLVPLYYHISPASTKISETLHLELHPKRLTRLLLEAAPLGIVAFLLALQIQIPRYIVEGLLNTRDLGLFSAATYLTFIGSLLVNALGAPACVRLAKHHAARDTMKFWLLMRKLLLIAGALGLSSILVSLLVGKQILTVLYTKEYSSMTGVLTVLCAASALTLLGSFLGYAMTAVHLFRIQVPLSLTGIIITAAACFSLTRPFGLMGTAGGILLGNAVQLSLSAVVLRRAAPTLSQSSRISEENLNSEPEAIL